MTYLIKKKRLLNERKKQSNDLRGVIMAKKKSKKMKGKKMKGNMCSCGSGKMKSECCCC